MVGRGVARSLNFHGQFQRFFPWGVVRVPGLLVVVGLLIQVAYPCPKNDLHFLDGSNLTINTELDISLNQTPLQCAQPERHRLWDLEPAYIKQIFYSDLHNQFFKRSAWLKRWPSSLINISTRDDPGHWTFFFCRSWFGWVVSVIAPLIMLSVLPYARGREFRLPV
jgi:hypothetical protein